MPRTGTPGFAGGTGHPLPQTAAMSDPSVITSLADATGPGYFTDQYGQPKLWVASETWALFNNAGAWNGSGGGTYEQDFDNFFSQRAAQGVTVTMLDVVDGVDATYANGNTWDGVTPFVSGGNPTTGLNSTFWTRVDYMMNSAARNGITIGFVFNSEYDTPTGGAFAGWTSTEFQAYGAAVGGRYKGQRNLIWLFGNDAWPTAYDSDWDSILTGIRGAGDTHMVGAWWEAEYTSRYETDNNLAASWGETNSAFNFCYTYNAGYWVAEYAYSETSSPDSQANLLPVIWGDGYFYQGSGGGYDSTLDRAMRQETWWWLASGSRGILTEAENIYHWTSTAPAAVTGNWFFAHNLGNIVTAYTSLPGWYELLPDLSSTLVTGGRGTRVSGYTAGGSGGTYENSFANSWVAASKTPSGSLAVMYLPNHTTITVNTALLAGGWAASWVDPITGAASSAGTGPTFNSTAKGTNSQGDPDWVLVFQS